MSPVNPAGAAALRLSPARAARDGIAAVVVSLAGISFYISSATLLFQGALAPQLPLGIGAALLGAAVLVAIGSWRGSLPLASAGPEPATIPVLAAITAGIAAHVAGPALLPTALAALAITSIAIGAAWWVMGQRGWGDLIRYIPYPVIGGFLGSVGWMMLTGGFGVAVGRSFDLMHFGSWWHEAADARLAAGAAIGVLIWRATLRFPSPLTLPLVLLASIGAVYAGLAAAGVDIASARHAGWLLVPFSHTLPAWPASPSLLGAVRWDAVAQEAPLIASAVIVATISLLLSGTSLEVAWDEDGDINRDLRALGQGNLLAGGLGGMVGGISISRSMLNRAAGAAGRGSSLLKSLLCLLAMAGGGPVLALVPRPVLGGMLVYLGLGMLKTWLVDSRRRLRGADHGTVVAMVAITAVAGFLPAVCVGVLVCCVDFAVSSARLAPVRRVIARRDWPSKAERSTSEAALLQREGARLRIVELQGMLFFGSTTNLSQQVEPLLGEHPPPERLLFDFEHVRGLDISAAQSLARLFKRLRREGVQVEVSRVSAPLRGALATNGALADAALHEDIDAALAAWDAAVLAQQEAAPAALEQVLRELLPSAIAPQRLLEHFEVVPLASGATLFERGDPPDAFYLVQSGRLAITAGLDGTEVLLRTVHAGSAIGEMGLFRNSPRSATARADGDVLLLRLSREGFEHLSVGAPDLAAALYRLFLLQLADRLDQSSRQAQVLAG